MLVAGVVMVLLFVIFRRVRDRLPLILQLAEVSGIPIGSIPGIGSVVEMIADPTNGDAVDGNDGDVDNGGVDDGGADGGATDAVVPSSPNDVTREAAPNTLSGCNWVDASDAYKGGFASFPAFDASIHGGAYASFFTGSGRVCRGR